MSKAQQLLHGEYCQDKDKEILDDLNKYLRELQQELIRKSVQCHELQVDLATQFNPRTMKTVLEARKECKMCCDYIASQKKDSPNDIA